MIAGNMTWRERVACTFEKKLTRETLVRVVADLVMVNFSLLASYTVHYVFAVSMQDPAVASPMSALEAHLSSCFNAMWVLSLVSIVIFSASGFYTYGRAYQGRFKALVVLQAVSVSYLILAGVNYFASDLFGTPRSVLLGSCVLSVLLLVGARIGSRMWKMFAAWELRHIPQPARGRSRSVLVIGGGGYIGSALVPKLLAGGYRVRVLDLFVYGREAIAEVAEHPHLEIVEGDFREVHTVVNAMQGIDAVVHLGAIVGDPACALNEQLTLEINLIATRMLAETAKGSGVSRFIFASTCSVYGANDQVLDVDEQSALNPVSLYARSKIASEKVLMEMADAKFGPVILRFGTLYGLSGRIRFDLIANLLTAKALWEGEMPLFGGDQWRSFVHVSDVASCIVKALRRPQDQVRGQIFNVGSDEQNYTLKEVAERIARLVPGAKTLELGVDGDRRNYRVNFSKVRKALDFKPEWTIEDGVRQIIRAMNDGVVTDYSLPEYSNVKFLSQRADDMLAPNEDWARELIHATVPVQAADDMGGA